MKKTLVLLSLCAGSAFSFAQTRQSLTPAAHSTLPNRQVQMPTGEKSLSCMDTLRYPQAKEQILGTSNFYTDFGVWNTDNESISQTFLNSGSLTITGVEFFGAMSTVDGGTSVTVNAAIYNVDASNVPTTILGSGNVTISVTTYGYRYVTLSSPVTVTGNYAVVLTPTNASGVLNLYVNDVAAGQSYDELFAHFYSTYVNYPNPGNWNTIPVFDVGSNYEPLIAPIVNYTINTAYTPSATTVCQGTPITFTNATTPSAILGNRMENYQIFRTYFGLAPSDSTFVYDMDNSSPFIWSGTTTYTHPAAGTYDVLLGTNGGFWSSCFDYATQTITVNPIPAAPTVTAGGPTTFCTGGSVTLTSSSATGNTWSTGETTQSITVSSAGSYTVTAASGGCTSPASTAQVITVNPIPATPTITAGGATTFCAGGSVTLTSSSATGNNWSNGATTPSITVSASGTYNVSVTTSGCTSGTSSDQTVTVNPVDDASFAYSSSTLCSGGANETPTAPMAGTFSSTTGLNFVDASTGEIDMSTSTDGTYVITHTTAGTCPATATQTVTITAAPDATFSYAQASYCALDTDPAVVFGSGASGGAFSATTGLALNTSTGVIDLSSSTPGDYTITNTIAASGSCPMTTATFDVTVVGSTTTTVAAGGTYCSGDAIPALPTTSTNSVTGTWSPAIDNMNTTTYMFTPDAGQCATTATTTITVNPNVTTAVAAGGTYCSGDAIPNLPTTSTNSITGTWSPAIDNMNTTTYTFTPDGGQCASTATTTITVNPTVTPAFAAGGTYCSGATVPALPTTSTNSVTGTWSPAINNTATTTYTFTPDAGQCAATASTTITVNPNPTVTFGAIAQLCVYNSPITLTQGAPAGGTYTGTGVTGTQFNPATAGLGTANLTYSYTDANGCSNTATSSVVVDACLGIQEVADLDVTIAPNPATESFVITSNGVDNLSYTVVTNDGRLVIASKNIANGVAETVNVQGFARGIYFIRLSSGTQTTTKKIIVE